MNRILFLVANLMALATHAAAFLLVAVFVAIAGFSDTGLVRECLDYLGGL